MMSSKEKESSAPDLQKSEDQKKKSSTSVEKPGETRKKIDPDRLKQFLGAPPKKKK